MDTGMRWLTKAKRAIAEWRVANSLSRGISLSAFALTALLVIGAGAIALGGMYSTLRHNVDNALDIDSRLLKRHLEAELNSLAINLSSLAANSHILRGLADPAARDSHLAPMLKEHVPPIPHFVTLAVYDAQGRTVATNATGDISAFGSIADVQQAIAAGSAVAGVQEDARGRRMLRLVYPLILPSTGKTGGALLGTVDLDEVFDDTASLLDPATGLHDFRLAGSATEDRAWSNEGGFIQRIWQANLVAPIDKLGLQVRIGQDEAAAFTPLRHMMIIYAAFGALVLAGALYFAHRAARRLASPISALSRTASRIAASGSFDIKAEVGEQRELATLAQAFNDMLDRLRGSYAQLLVCKSEFKTLVENSPDLIARFDRELRCIYVNRMVQSIFGIPPGRVINRSAQDLDIRKSAQRIMTRLFQEGGEQTCEHHAGERYFEARFVAEYGSGGSVVSVLCIMRDVTARRAAEEGLQLANHAIESSDSPVMVTSFQEPDHPLKYVNPAFERLTGYTAEEVIGRNCRFLQGEDHDQPELDIVRSALRDQREARVLLRNYRKDGSRFWNALYIAPVADANGMVTHFVGEITDITAEREQQEQLHHQATHDALTGLPNRRLLIDRLMQAISYAQRYQRMIAVAFLDLDKFKFINDTMGHDAGDQTLKIVAERLSGCVRDSDSVARLGGDEFVLVLYDQANEDITYHAMQRVLRSISQPMLLNGRKITVTCSIGFAVYPQDGRDAETLLKNADTAMYRAKELGRDNFQFYTEDLHTRINERLAMEKGLRRALEKEEFVLHYQPRVELASGKIVSMEALIRWNHPTLGLVEPLRFVPLAEELGLIQQIGEWVMRNACRQQKSWQQDYVADLPISVNISATQFLQKDFTQTVAGVLREAGIDATRLELEITESLSMQDPPATIRVLRELKRLGIKVSLDDFGTGYSNLTYMKQFPLDTIKLDQSFVRDIVRNPEDLAISDAVIAMAHSLNLKVTAEGVESATQLALLADHGCDEMQGFYFSAAMPVGDCTALLRENRTLPMEKLGRQQANRTLLLIDDEPHVLTALERILRRTGFKILTSPSAIDAFDLMAMHEVGVILSDQRMPEMTGVEFFGRIRHMYPETVRMILSGYTDIDAVTNAINVGAVYKFLNKPWDANDLTMIVNEAFEKYEKRAKLAERVTEQRAPSNDAT